MKSGKWCSAREALRQSIQPGDRIFFSIASGQPQTLLRALAEDSQFYRDVEVINGILFAEHPLAKKGLESSFRCISFQNSASLRQDWVEGRIDFLPVRYSDVPRVFSRKGPKPLGVVLIQVSPPDHRGRFSLGVSTSHAYPLALEARTIVAIPSLCNSRERFSCGRSGREQEETRGTSEGRLPVSGVARCRVLSGAPL